MTVEWRDIPGWEGRYQAGSHGRIRRCRHTRVDKRGHRRRYSQKVLAGFDHVDGYRQVKIGRTRTVHSIIAEVFIGPRPEGLLVCHGDGNPANNRRENLRYDTPVANAADRIRHGREAARTWH